MRIFFSCRFLLALTLMGWGQFVFAVEYYWTSSSTGSQRFSSPSSLCTSVQTSVTIFSTVLITGTSGTCRMHYAHAPDNFSPSFPISRNGDSCLEGANYNAQTGDCEAPPDPEPNQCESKIGQSHSFGGDMGQMETCVAGCTVAVDASSKDPVTTYKKPGDISKTYWWVTGAFTGEECSSSDDGSDSNPPAPTESKSDRDCTPTTTAEDGTQTSSCTETKTDVDNRDCVSKGGSVGSVNGVMQCVASNKGPKATETKKETKTESKTNPDGSKTDTTTTKTEQKNCSGAGACSTNTTTNVNNSNTNADGTKGGESSTCTGSNCTGSGTGDGNGDGNGEGDGEGEEEGDGPAGPGSTLQKGEQGTFAEGIAEWDQRLTDIQGDLDSKLGQYSTLFSGVFDLNLSEGGGSLPCESTTLKQGATVSLCISEFSGPLSWLRLGLLLAAAVFSAYIVLRN